jgi:butyryl-CoA dehydrogenase
MKKVSSGDAYEKYMLILELLTPVAKSYPAETSCLSTSWALQCFGGYGFTKDFVAELYYRQTRIHTLHEGTTAIHGMDLLGRKMMLQGGKATMLLLQEVMIDIHKAAKYEDLKAYGDILSKNLDRLQGLMMHLMGVAQKEGTEAFLSDATLFLELFGLLVMGWIWLKMAVVAKENDGQEHCQSVLLCNQYYFAYEMPKSQGLFTRLSDTTRITLGDIEERL